MTYIEFSNFIKNYKYLVDVAKEITGKEITGIELYKGKVYGTWNCFGETVEEDITKEIKNYIFPDDIIF